MKKTVRKIALSVGAIWPSTHALISAVSAVYL